MLSCIKKHNDTTDDHHHNAGKNNQTGIQEILKSREGIPLGRSKGRVNIDEEQCKHSCKYYQPYQVGFVVKVGRYLPA